jgi:hypothetical protein
MEKAGFVLELMVEIAAVELDEAARKIGEKAALAFDIARHPLAYYLAYRESRALSRLSPEEQMHYHHQREQESYELL